jgi:hypothetical protein
MKSLFFTAFAQVFFVACSTVAISQQSYAGTVLAAFAINWIWTGNVKRVAFGGTRDRIVYALGATTGSAAGLAFSTAVLRALA